VEKGNTALRVAIANRGEVALRIIRACQELGHTSILLHSTPDKKTAAFRAADETVELVGQSPPETYLNIEKVIAAAVSGQAEAIHPGFGFLSENPHFAEKTKEAKIKFIGPSAECIRISGNKIHAKELAIKARVPVLPAFSGDMSDSKKLLSEIRKIGFPCIVKAASGGGGKGMKVVRDETEFFEALTSAQREAQNAFGSSEVFIEKYLVRPRHVEVQILFDEHKNGLHFFERDCSIQRRHQKIFEESPSINLSPQLRTGITQAALMLANAAGYSSAGTVEFLVDDEENFYFMEFNTRLQVEHTVTEFVCGVDLVHLQFLVAQREKLPFPQEAITQRGHALEVRVYAENPAREFLPSTGVIEELLLPAGPFRRFDFGVEKGDEITPFYDPMIGKIITWAPTRAENIERMLATLDETVIFGVHTNIEFLKAVLRKENFKQNKINTGFLETEFKDGFKLPPLTENQSRFIQESKRASSHDQKLTGGSLKYQPPWVAE
jgi:acetyl/propionyl-CoA carboxylase alpha subunit